MIRYEVSDGLCVLRLDAPPMNPMSFEVLHALVEGIARAVEQQDVRGIVITGRPDHFSAGADVNLFQQVASADDAVRISRVFQEAFDAVEQCPKPVVAAVAGNVLGGALELAMACHRRLAATGSRFRMPEVQLGINPGAGGTQRLPRLVGMGPALQMLLTASTVSADDALAMGLIDAVCPAEELLDRARQLALEPQEIVRSSLRTDKLQNGQANAAAFHKADAILAAGRPEIIAPRKIVEAVRYGLDDGFSAGLQCEQRVFAECLQTPAARNKVALFFATRQTAKLPELADVKPADVRRAAVVGMGSMGTGIAQALLSAGLPTVVVDENTEALARGRGKIEKSLAGAVARGKLAQEKCDASLARLQTTTQWQDLAGVDLVIEAVFEQTDVKRAVIGRIEEVCREDAIVGTNTSTIVLDELAEGMRHADRLVGLHFFNPAHRMPLVEVIRRDATPPGPIATALALTKQLRKTPVVVRSREGFVVNRLFLPYLKEAFWLLEEGADPEAIDQAMVEFGFPMGPLTLIDMAGLDILAATDRVMVRAFAHHGELSPIVDRLVEQGHLGQKTGAGVYQYAQGDYTPHRSDVAGQIIAQRQREKGLPPSLPGREAITRRLVLRMVAEAFCLLEEGVARSASDVDVATVLGIGFPDFRGGIVTYARQLGLDEVRAQLNELTNRHGRRFAVCRFLEELKGDW